jgi:hypothetical protein
MDSAPEICQIEGGAARWSLRTLSLLRPKFVHALTRGIQAVMDDQALRRALFLLLNLSHAESDVVTVIKVDKLSNDTEYSPEESPSIGKPLHDLEVEYAFAAPTREIICDWSQRSQCEGPWSMYSSNLALLVLQ